MRWPAFAWPRLTRRRGVREAGLALVVALAVLLVLTHFENWSVLRGLETASLDLRFRLRGVTPPGPEMAIVLVDDRSLAALGRWPLSRRLFAKAVQLLDRAGARVIAFDLLFPEPERPISRRTCAARRKQRRAGLPQTQDPAVARRRCAARRRTIPTAISPPPCAPAAKCCCRSPSRSSGPDGGRAAANWRSRSTCGSTRAATSRSSRCSRTPAVLPIPPLAEAAAGLGHVDIAFDRDGAPRYDYLALPFGGDFVPSLPVRAAAAYLGVPWNEVGLALGDGVRLGDSCDPERPGDAARHQLSRPARHDPDLFLCRSGRGPGAGGAAQGTHRLDRRLVHRHRRFLSRRRSAIPRSPAPSASPTSIDTILARDFIRENPPPWPLVVIGLVAALAVATGVAAALLPTRLAALGGAVPILGWAGGAQVAFEHGLWLPLVNPVAALAAATAAVLLFRYGFVDRAAPVHPVGLPPLSRARSGQHAWRRIPSGCNSAARPAC